MKSKITLSLTIMLCLIIALSACGGGKTGGGPVDIVIGGPAETDATDETGADSDSTDSGDKGKAEVLGSTVHAISKDIRLVSDIYSPYEECLMGRYHYDYDDANRLYKITVDGGPNAGVWNITYPDDETVYYENPDKSYYFTLSMGDEGVMTNYAGFINGAEVDQVLEYKDGYLDTTTTKTMGFTTVNSYIWNDSQLDIFETKIMGQSFKTTYKYGDILNVECSISPWVTSHLKNWYTPTHFCGNMSPNLVSSEYQALENLTIDYRFETDEKGYVTNVYYKKNNGEELLLYEVKYY